MLALEGARATPAGDGRQALDILRAQPQGFAAVLMDIQMPVLDGLSATRTIRGELGLTGLPVIAVTAGVLQEERQRARAAGVDDFLPKPVELEQLVAVLARRLGPDRPDAAPPPSADATSGPEDATDLPTILGIAPAQVAQLAQLAGGDAAGFRRLLQGFVAEVTDLPQQVQADLAAGAPAAAASRLHRLRGTAANLGALDLARTARQLEEAIGAHGQAVEDLWVQFNECLAALMESVTPWLAETPPAWVTATSAGPLDAAQFADRLAALRAALATNRPRPARQLFAELAPGLVQVYGAEAVQSMSRAMDGLRFDEVLRALGGEG
jgi:CheY-like chemotaxis protein